MIHFPTTPDEFCNTHLRCSFGITEALAVFTPEIIGGIGDLFGVGAADAGALAGSSTFADLIGGGSAAGAGAGGALATLPGSDIASIIGSGEGLFGGPPGLAGTLLSGGSGLTLADLAAGTTGLGAAGTAADFLAAPGASAFNPAALTPTAFGGDVTAVGGLPSNAANANAAVPGGGSPALTQGSASVPGVAGGSPSAVPAGSSAGGVAAPSGVAGSPDATSVFSTGTSPIAGSPGATPSPSIAGLTGGAPGGSVPGAAGATSVGGAPLGAAPPGASSSIADMLSPGNLANSAVKSLASNPLGIALGAGGLGYSIYQGSQNTKNEQALTADAKIATDNSNALMAQGQGLTNYLTNGTLPPQYQTQITQALNSAVQAAKSRASAQGQSADPKQNSQLQGEIDQIMEQQPILQERLAAQLASTGTSLIGAGAQSAGLSGNLYQALVQNDTTQAANAGKAIASLAAAMASKSQATLGSTPITIG
jgi:hypothetical protein